MKLLLLCVEEESFLLLWMDTVLFRCRYVLIVYMVFYFVSAYR
ncbi:004R [Invertebrate iridescent virus Kaz2018]|uniref:004R n=1 Tax=Invertebrate iridescent virus 6 TaxID=176652 RepID=Q91G90_IIV6|nr:004R [Invertebrate iridescent virus 6]AAK81941.1 004R [Invertebrate iridescent virus 6]QMS79338.1 hypothetical protein IIV6-T1_005 [Invertebrate iridescent virus 6]QNH08416.1 004R [Invertebrate iridescent virus Kaz2018]